MEFVSYLSFFFPPLLLFFPMHAFASCLSIPFSCAPIVSFFSMTDVYNGVSWALWF